LRIVAGDGEFGEDSYKSLSTIGGAKAHEGEVRHGGHGGSQSLPSQNVRDGCPGSG
jgi:hypothetical protein